MKTIQLGNAPCSWGTLEFEGLEGERIAYRQMLDELVETGYTGTELGDWGFMPTDPSELQRELESRGVTLLSAFVPVRLKLPLNATGGVSNAVKVARLLAEASPRHQPYIILADDNGSEPLRTANAGRATPEMGLTAEEWNIFARNAEEVSRAVLGETGLHTLFHHHCAGYVETPQEIDRLLEKTDPTLINLVFDAGHYVFGSGSNQAGGEIAAALDRYGGRIAYVHFKDCHPIVADQSRQQGWDYFQTVRQGVFCELGKGCVDFDAILAWLNKNNYRGWITVEQDVLPGMGSPKDSARRNRQFLQSIGL